MTDPSTVPDRSRADGRADTCTKMSKRTKLPCRGLAIKGTDPPLCRMHGGGAPQVRRKAAARVAIAEAVEHFRHLGGSVDVDPHDALLATIRETSANVEFYRWRVQQLESGGTRTRPATSPSEPGAFLYVNRKGDDESDWDGEWVVEEAGIYGRDHLGDGKPHILVVMYNAERDRLVRYSKAAIDAKIDDRLVAVAERYGTGIARVFTSFLTDPRIIDVIPAASSDVVRVVMAEKMRELGA